MRLAEYLPNAFWAALDKALPLVYGFGYVLLVVAVLPEEEFGLLGVLMNIIFYFILAVDNTLVQTPMSKFLAEEDHSGWAIPNGFLLSFAVLSLGGVACMVGSGFVAAAFNAPDLEAIMAYLLLLLASYYLKDLSVQMCIAKQWTGRLFVIDAVYFLGSLVVLIVWKYIGTLATAKQVILANVYAALAASAIGVVFTFPLLKRASWRIQSRDSARFLTFGKYSFGAGMGAYLNGQLDLILVGHFCGIVPLAVYNAGKIIYRFYNAFSQATQVLIFPLASKLASSGKMTELRSLFEKSIFFAYMLLIPLNCALLIGADWIISLLYHGQYAEAVPIFRWLLIGAFFLPWGAVGINILLGADKPRLSFRITWIVVAVNFICSVLLIKAFGIRGAAMVIAITSAVGAALTTYYIKSLTHFTWRGISARHGDITNFIRTIRSRNLDASR